MKLESFSEFNNMPILNEALKSSILKKIDPKDLKQLAYKIDLENITDADIHEIPDPKVLTKKPYTTNGGYDWMILVMGDTTEYNYKTKENVTTFGLQYSFFGTNVNSAQTNHSHSRRGNNTPTRKQLIDNAAHYKFYAINVSEAAQAALGNKRRERSSRKWSNQGRHVLINPNEKDWQDRNNREKYNDEIKKKNLDRYSQKIKEGSDFTYVYQLFQEKITEASKELCALIEETKYRQSRTDKHELKYDIKKNIEKLSYASKETIELAKKFTWDIKSDILYTKVDILNALFHEFVDLLTNTPTEETLKKIKNLIKFVKSFKSERKSLSDVKMEYEQESNAKDFFENE